MTLGRPRAFRYGRGDEGGPIYRKILLYTVAVVVAVGCGGGDDAAEANSTSSADGVTTNPSAKTTTNPAESTSTGDMGDGGEGQGTELCEVVNASFDSDDVDVFDPEAFEESSRQNLRDLEGLEGEIPSQIEDEFVLVLEANREFVALLEEYDWMILSIPEDEPRMLTMSSDEVLAASQSILDFCGVDLGVETDPGEESGELDDLFPPGAGQVLSSDPILMVESSASYEDLVDHYEELLGRAPVNESEGDGFRSGTFTAQFEGDQVVIFIEESADGVLVAISSG